MNDYVFLYRGGERPSGTPDQMQNEMQRWMTWLKGLNDAGHVKDMGHPLEQTGKLVKGRQRTITDGPFAETKDIIGGYTLVSARDLTHAAELTSGCPIFDNGGAVEVRPIMKTGM